MMRGAARLLVVDAATVAAAVLLTWATGSPHPRRALAALTASPADAAVVALVGLLAWACLAWVAATVLVANVAALPGATGRLGATVARRIAPVLARRLLDALLGVTLATGATAMLGAAPAAADVPPPRPAGAAALSLDWPGAGARAAATTGDDLPPLLAPPPDAGAQDEHPSTRPGASAGPPSASAGPPSASAGPPSASAGPPSALPATAHPAVGLVASQPLAEHVADRPSAATVVVRRGDTLWDIAARHLGPSAGAAEIAAAWPRWFAANRAVIGADPDLLLPGQRLAVPPPAG